MIISVRTVDTINPPITTVANGLCTSAPADVAIAIGTNPNEATSPVRNTGLSRCGHPCLIILPVHMVYSFFFLKSLKWLIIRIPFNTATPNRAINPTPAEILNGNPLSHKATIPPISDNGTVETQQANK